MSRKDETPSLLEPSHDENLLNSTKTPTPSSRQGVRFATQVAFPVALLPEAEALVSRAWEAKKSAQAAKAARRANISANAQSTLPQATVIASSMASLPYSPCLCVRVRVTHRHEAVDIALAAVSNSKCRNKLARTTIGCRHLCAASFLMLPELLAPARQHHHHSHNHPSAWPSSS